MQHLFRRTVDLTARYGGEEFAAILPSVGLEEALSLANALRKAVWDLALAHRSSTVAERVTLSIGVAARDSARDHTPAALLERADRALYRAKETGRNRVCTSE